MDCLMVSPGIVSDFASVGGEENNLKKREGLALREPKGMPVRIGGKKLGEVKGRFNLSKKKTSSRGNK